MTKSLKLDDESKMGLIDDAAHKEVVIQETANFSGENFFPANTSAELDSRAVATMKSNTFGKDSEIVGTTVDQTKVPEPESKMGMLLNMKNTIENMTSRMSNFETTVSSKISVLEKAYGALESKLDSLH